MLLSFGAVKLYYFENFLTSKESLLSVFSKYILQRFENFVEYLVVKSSTVAQFLTNKFFTVTG